MDAGDCAAGHAKDVAMAISINFSGEGLRHNAADLARGSSEVCARDCTLSKGLRGFLGKRRSGQSRGIERNNPMNVGLRKGHHREQLKGLLRGNLGDLFKESLKLTAPRPTYPRRTPQCAAAGQMQPAWAHLG